QLRAALCRPAGEASRDGRACRRRGARARAAYPHAHPHVVERGGGARHRAPARPAHGHHSRRAGLWPGRYRHAPSRSRGVDGAGEGRGRMSIFLIRHGETLGNASRTVQLPDNQLSPRGAAQAERLARRLAPEGIALILSSDYARAVTTADHLRRATGAPVRYSPLLQERNFGDLRGTPYAELGFDMFEPDYAPPNGETWEAFHARVDRAWALVQDTAAHTDGHLAVVTHGLV